MGICPAEEILPKTHGDGGGMNSGPGHELASTIPPIPRRVSNQRSQYGS